MKDVRRNLNLWSMILYQKNLYVNLKDIYFVVNAERLNKIKNGIKRLNSLFVNQEHIELNNNVDFPDVTQDTPKFYKILCVLKDIILSLINVNLSLPK